MPESPQLLLISVLIAIGVIIALAARGVGANRRVAFLRETVLVLTAFFVYHAVRSATEGSVTAALDNARLIERVERSLGLFVEPAFQAAVVGERWIVDLANWIYIWGFWPVIGIIAIWLYYSRPVSYRLFRNAFLISGAIGLVVFMTFRRHRRGWPSSGSSTPWSSTRTSTTCSSRRS